MIIEDNIDCVVGVLRVLVRSIEWVRSMVRNAQGFTNGWVRFDRGKGAEVMVSFEEELMGFNDLHIKKFK